MKVNDILRKKADANYQGYLLDGISETSITDLTTYKQLKRVPHKISSFLIREKIKKVFKSDCFVNPLDEYYLVLSTDGTIFHLDY